MVRELDANIYFNRWRTTFHELSTDASVRVADRTATVHTLHGTRDGPGMRQMSAVNRAYAALGESIRSFRCCDTDFTVSATGVGASGAVDRARGRALDLEAQLNAFDHESDVSELAEIGRVENHHVARIVRRGLEYLDRTDGVFDIRHGDVERAVKAYIRGDTESDDAFAFDDGTHAPDDGTLRSDDGTVVVSVDDDVVTADLTLDLNGLAKGYIVDRTYEALAGIGRRGFVDGGGDLSPPTGPVAIESPYGDETPLDVLDTDWYIATSGGYRRRRKTVDHIYNPKERRTGSHNDLVTVVARRDCMEADALATTLAALPVDDALALIESWAGAEALIVHGGVFHRSGGFDAHQA